MKPVKKLAERTLVPQSAEQAAEMLAEIGQKQRFISHLQTELDGTVARMKATTEELATPAKERIAELTRGLEIWASANRQALTLGRSKTITLATGVLRWRQSPPAVKLTKPAEVLAVIRELGLHGFLRTKQEIDKEALLKAPDQALKIPGVTITQAEAFEVEPTKLDLAPAPPAGG